MEITTDDGTRITGTFYEATQAKGAVLIVSAMGVAQTFYAKQARWLAANGFHTLTFDYRGIAASRRGPLKDERADIVTWAEQDTAAALQALKDRVGALPITWVGHSLGGQIVPFVSNHTLAAKVVTVATGSGYWRENAAQLKRKSWLFWFVAVPIATPLFGYFPGRRLGMVGDLPRNAIAQWKKWCMSKDYAVGDGPEVRQRYASVKTPIVSLSFTDDDMMSEQNIRSIHGFYTGAQPTLRRFSPSELSVKQVGHFGFFRQEALWSSLLLPALAS